MNPYEKLKPYQIKDYTIMLIDYAIKYNIPPKTAQLVMRYYTGAKYL